VCSRAIRAQKIWFELPYNDGVKGMTFRDAYHEVATMISTAAKNAQQIGRPELSYESAVDNRNNFGGTSKQRVKQSIERIRLELLK
jgi:argininosuccinate lyase